MNNYDVNLTDGIETNLAAVGNFVFIKSGVGSVTVRAGDTELDMVAGQGMTLPEVFKNVRLTGSGAFVLVVGIGEFKDTTISGAVTVTSGNMTVDGGQLEVTKQVSPASVWHGTVDCLQTTNTQIRAANANRREVLICNPSNAQGSIWINGTGGVPAGVGVEVQPGQTLVLTTRSEIWAANSNGFTVSVGFLELVE